MSSDTVIEIQGLDKSFTSYKKPQQRFWQLISEAIGDVFERPNIDGGHLVLSNINLKVKRGETVGLLGANGAGKSTLLSLICGIYQPTKGEVVLQGKVSSILELGTGFNNELTGRENLYLVAAMRGFNRTSLDEHLNEILAFADIGCAIDEATKTYSSGMYMRLAFALCVHLTPEVLVIDEALAVGDEAFQSKCFQKLRQLKAEDVTIIFVSHASQLILELCDRAVLLDGGELILEGEPAKVIDQYHKLLYAPESMKAAVRTDIQDIRLAPSVAKINVQTNIDSFFDPDLLVKPAMRFANQGAKISEACMRLSSGHSLKPVNITLNRENYQFCFRVEFAKPFSKVRFGMLLKNRTGIELGGAETSDQWLEVQQGEATEITFSFPMALNPGIYFLNAGVLAEQDGRPVFLDRLIDAWQFRVLPADNHQTAMVDFNIEANISSVKVDVLRQKTCNTNSEITQ